MRIIFCLSCLIVVLGCGNLKRAELCGEPKLESVVQAWISQMKLEDGRYQCSYRDFYKDGPWEFYDVSYGEESRQFMRVSCNKDFCRVLQVMGKK